MLGRVAMEWNTLREKEQASYRQLLAFKQSRARQKLDSLVQDRIPSHVEPRGIETSGLESGPETESQIEKLKLKDERLSKEISDLDRKIAGLQNKEEAVSVEELYEYMELYDPGHMVRTAPNSE